MPSGFWLKSIVGADWMTLSRTIAKLPEGGLVVDVVPSLDLPAALGEQAGHVVELVATLVRELHRHDRLVRGRVEVLARSVRVDNGAGIHLLSADKHGLAMRDDVFVDVHVVSAWAARLIGDSASHDDLGIMPWGVDAIDLLPGWYDDWALVERERVRQRLLHALEALSRQLVAGAALRRGGGGGDDGRQRRAAP